MNAEFYRKVGLGHVLVVGYDEGVIFGLSESEDVSSVTAVVPPQTPTVFRDDDEKIAVVYGTPDFFDLGFEFKFDVIICLSPVEDRAAFEDRNREHFAEKCYVIY